MKLYTVSYDYDYNINFGVTHNHYEFKHLFLSREDAIEKAYACLIDTTDIFKNRNHVVVDVKEHDFDLNISMAMIETICKNLTHVQDIGPIMDGLSDLFS